MKATIKKSLTLTSLALGSALCGLSMVTLGPFEKTIVAQASKKVYTAAVAVLFLGTLSAIFMLKESRLRRKSLLVLADLINMFGHFCIFMYPKIVVILVSRFLIGVSVGILSLVVPQYIFLFRTDTCVFLIQSMHSLFSGIGFVAGLALTTYLNQSTIFIILVLYFVFHILTLLVLPRFDQSDFHKKTSRTATISDLLLSEPMRRQVFISFLLHASQNFTGNSHLSIFLNTIFPSKHAPVIFNLLATATGMLSLPFLSFFRRKTMILTSLLIVFLSLVLLFSEKVSRPLSISLFFIGYNSGLHSTPWLIIPEIYDEKHLEAGLSFCVIVNYLCAFVMVALVGCIELYLGRFAFLLYAVFTGAVFLMMVFLFDGKTTDKLLHRPKY